MTEKWITIEAMDNGTDHRISHAVGMSWIEVLGLLDIAQFNKRSEYLNGTTINDGGEDANTSTSAETTDIVG